MVRKYRKDFQTCYKTPVKDLLLPFERFITNESSSSILLIFSVIIAIIIANTALGTFYFNFFETPFRIGFGDFVLEKPLLLWINDGLMAIFFFLVGLEIKRELLTGELSEYELVKLPFFAAIGGIVVPIILYVSFNFGQPSLNGWAIPMATDIAMVLGLLAIFGRRVPLYLKIFVTSMAIIDDIASILVIAIFFTSSMKIDYLFLAIALIVVLFLMNRLRIRQSYIYMIVGVILWFAFLKSGIHATITGIILALMIPATKKLDIHDFRVLTQSVVNTLVYDDPSHDPNISPEVYLASIQTLEQGCHDIQPPLFRLENFLSAWVSFLIIPLFAFANSGLVLESFNISTLFNSQSLGVIIALVIGKPLGVTLFTWFSVKQGYTKLPEEISWRMLHSVTWLAGIGFTMSFFISTLAFSDPSVIVDAKISILIASVIAAIVGLGLLNKFLPVIDPDTEVLGICEDIDDLDLIE
jgi:NhaA family Na+:H+ antiporter